MKKIIALLLVSILLITACSSSKNANIQVEEATGTVTNEEDTEKESAEAVVEFGSLNDPKLIQYLEETVYQDVITDLDSDKYLVENVSAIYISKEYLDELAYNSLDNVYFGYTLPELESQLGEDKYVFTCNDEGETIIAPYEEYDDTYDQIIKNVAIGAGVILLCVTVSAVTGGAGLPAVSMVFAMSAKTGTAMALSSGAISGAVAATVTGYQTQDVEETLKSAALATSEWFKWGAITGAVAGGAAEVNALRGATLNGLSMNQAAAIQKESGFSVDIIKQFHSMEEYQIYKKAGLYTKQISGKTALVRDIDLEYVSELPDGTKITNLEKIKKGLAPVDPSTGKVYQLHHIGQKSDGALSILTEAEHQGNATILNIAGKSSEIDRNAFNKIRKEFWQSYATLYS